MIKKIIKQTNWVLLSFISLAAIIFVREKFELSRYGGQIIDSASATIPDGGSQPEIPDGGDGGDGGVGNF